ncbi:hypothetical protein BP6252_07172 [Coleophoma cylindrospora]|uniref:Rhodopsin domain-containing protein n=1 Tax=Coleophoma cylindrospora TaxID=1849047 RepID=A0A3D8RGT4_9HELO|nr:hypothetical protein BP6252_07172 [Coleophoma cylindrospora]
MGVVSVSSIIFVFLVIFQCNPVSHFWHQLDPTNVGKCFSTETTVAVSSTYGVILAMSDFVFAGIPFFMVWNLKMHIRMKISVVTLMSLGALAGVAAIVRIIFLKFIAGGSDFFFTSALLTIFTTLELSVGLIVGSTATLRPLFKRFLGDHSTHGSSNNNGGRSTTDDGRAWEFYSNNADRRINIEADRSVELTKVKVTGGGTGSRFSKTYGKPKKTGFENDSEEELTAELNMSIATKSGINKATKIERTEEISSAPNRSFASSIRDSITGK